MTALGDMLSAADRQRLNALARPDDVQELAQAARDAAAESSGAGRSAWIACAIAITTSGSLDEARFVLEEILEPGALQTLARACLATLSSDDTNEIQP